MEGQNQDSQLGKGSFFFHLLQNPCMSHPSLLCIGHKGQPVFWLWPAKLFNTASIENFWLTWFIAISVAVLGWIFIPASSIRGSSPLPLITTLNCNVIDIARVLFQEIKTNLAPSSSVKSPYCSCSILSTSLNPEFGPGFVDVKLKWKLKMKQFP